MGMYDYLNGEQVKCFYSNLHCKENDEWQVCRSGGNLVEYQSGDELPLKTFYYKYPKDFLILDEFDNIVHTIKDGKLHNTEELDDILNIDTYLLNNVYDYYGKELKISSLENLKEYPVKADERKTTIVKSRKEFTPSSNKMLASFRILNREKYKYTNVQKYKYEDIIDILEEDDLDEFNSLIEKLNYNFKLDMNSPLKSKVLLKSVLDNKDNHDCIIQIIKSKAEELFDRYKNRLDVENKKLDNFLNPYLKEFDNKWIKENQFEIEMQMGVYISIINDIESFKRETLNYFMESDKESLEVAKSKLKELINLYTIDRYIQWLEPSKEQEEIIFNIVNNLTL